MISILQFRNFITNANLNQGGGGGGGGENPPENGWFSSTNTYYINSQATTLNEFGDGTWNGDLYSGGVLFTGTSGGVYYVNGNPANGVYSGTYYQSGVAATGTSGGVYYVSGSPANGVYNGTYYQSGVAGTGTSGGVYYVSGSPAQGLVGGTYYVNGVAGTGSSGGIYYVSGSPANGVYSGTYYVNGVAGTGTSGGVYYVSGSPANGIYDGVYYQSGISQLYAEFFKPSDQQVHYPTSLNLNDSSVYVYVRGYNTINPIALYGDIYIYISGSRDNGTYDEYGNWNSNIQSFTYPHNTGLSIDVYSAGSPALSQSAGTPLYDAYNNFINNANNSLGYGGSNWAINQLIIYIGNTAVRTISIS